MPRDDLPKPDFAKPDLPAQNLPSTSLPTSDLPGHGLPKHDPEQKVGALAKSAESRLNELLQYRQLEREQWLMRLSVNGQARGWEPLTSDSAQNDAIIKERIAGSEKPVTELVLGFIGMVVWRGNRRFMAYLQYFESEYGQGLLCLRHLKEGLPEGTFEPFGGFLIVGACKNIWI